VIREIRTMSYAAITFVATLLVGPSPGRATESTSRAVAPAEPQDSDGIELDLTGLEPIDPGLRAEVAKAIHATAAEVVARHELPAEKIHVRVAWQDQADVDYAIRIHIDAHEWMAASDHPATTGPDASASGLTDVIAAALERALADWSRRHDANRPAATPVSTVTPASVTAADDDAARVRRLGRVGWAGVGLAIAGAGSVAGGVAAVVIGRTVDPDDAFRLRDWRYTGYALIGIGSAAIIAGSVMAIVDSRKRRRSRSGTAMLVPAPMHRGAAVAFSLTF
jgi:hypothetical protein